MNINTLLTSDVDVLSGRPVFCGTRVPVDSFFDHLVAGITTREFIEEFPTVAETQLIGVLKVAATILLARNAQELIDSIRP